MDEMASSTRITQFPQVHLRIQARCFNLHSQTMTPRTQRQHLSGRLPWSGKSQWRVGSPNNYYLASAKTHAAVKSSYETITSIHIYSLSPSCPQDLQTVSDTGRHLYSTYFAKEDPLKHNATYGVILNSKVRRRTGRRPLPPTIEPTPTIKSENASKVSSTIVENPTAAPQPSVKKEETSRPSSAGSTTRTSSTTKQTSLKRDTSDIFKSFAKARSAAAKPTPNLSRNNTDSSVGNTSEDKDSKPPTASEDEGESEEEALFLDTQTRTAGKKRSSTGKAEREAKLRKMMDDEDDDNSDAEMEDADLIDPEQAGLGKGDQPRKDGKSQEAALKQGTATEAMDAEEAQEGVNWSDSDAESQLKQPKKREAPESKPEAEAEPEAAIANPLPKPSRRRGKRKVLKKKTMRDEENYLVTREEAVWESFSEDEPEPAKAKIKPVGPKPQSQSQSQSQSQGKVGSWAEVAEKERRKGKGKSGASAGTGNIMSFFGKK